MTTSGEGVPERAYAAARAALHDLECPGEHCSHTVLGMYDTQAHAALGSASGLILETERRRILNRISRVTFWQADEAGRTELVLAAAVRRIVENQP